MEKVIVTLRTGTADDAWAERLRGPVVDELLALDPPGLTVHVRDAAVRDALMTLTTLDPPVQALVSLWTQQYYGDQTTTALDTSPRIWSPSPRRCRRRRHRRGSARPGWPTWRCCAAPPTSTRPPG